jgi:hypothetical protein
MLQAVIDLDTLEAQGQSLRRSMAELTKKKDVYGDEALTALASLMDRADELDVVSVPIEKLRDGMVLCDDLKTKDGVLILPRGFAINESSREHLANFKSRLVEETIRVQTPQSTKAQIEAEATSARKHA